MKTLDKKEKERLIVSMISDCIIWNRVSDGLFNILNVVQPMMQKHCFWPDQNYDGLSNIYLLMDITDEELIVNIDEKFHNMCYTTEPVKELAQKIYIEWLVEIRNHYTEKKENNLTKV